MPQTLPGSMLAIGVFLLLLGFLLAVGKVELGPIKLPKLGRRASSLKVLGGIFTLLGFGMYFAGFIPVFDNQPTPTPPATMPSPASTSTITPTLLPTATSTSTPTNTPIPLPLVEIFPQSVDGQEFTFVNEGGIITPEFVGDENCTHSGVYGLRISYDMQGQSSGGWGAHWVNPPAVTHFDASEYEFLTFWVRGMVGSERFQVSMKDTNNREYWIESRSLVVVSKSWTMVSIPLNQFRGVNTASVENLAFGFNHTHGSGSICIDDIAFAP